VCEAACEPAANKAVKSDYEAPNVDGAWQNATEAMRELLSGQHRFIDDVSKKTLKIVVDQAKSSKALTLDNGPTAYPTILLAYRGETYDSLVIAHELGHALQIRASSGKFVPPILREICAFLGESALLSYALENDAALHGHLLAAWRAENFDYFGRLKDGLQRALSRSDAPYEYSWNYPLARYFAIQIAERCSEDWIWSLYKGETSLRGVLRELHLQAGE